MTRTSNEPRFISQRNLCKRLGITVRVLMRLRAEGRAPQGVRVGPRTVLYPIEQVEEFEAAIRKAAA